MKNKEVVLTHVASRDQAADIFTKALPTVLFEHCKTELGLRDKRELRLGEEFVEIS